ncbi:protein phosphatase 2C domain-containing protein [Streptomyces sp. NBC_00104]|uniref:PP2C family protein-serine/threonine phosphatase n=1 Tax=unclassified Streptomyces TaxID=2593676 RepID=UPI002E20F597
MNSTHLLLTTLALVGTFVLGAVVGATARRRGDLGAMPSPHDAWRGAPPGHGAAPGHGAPPGHGTATATASASATAEKSRPPVHDPGAPTAEAADAPRPPEGEEEVPTGRRGPAPRPRRKERGGDRSVPVPELPALALPAAAAPVAPRRRERPNPHDGPAGSPAAPAAPAARSGPPARRSAVPGRARRSAASSPTAYEGAPAAGSSGTRLVRSSPRKALTAAESPDSRWLDVAAATSSGRRTTNEDAYFVDDELAVIADGVGGAPAGDLASRLAVQAVVDAWHAAGSGSVRALQAGFRQATGVIRAHTQDRPQLLGMATTLDACGLVGGTVVGAHVGDGTVWAVRQDDQLPHRLTTPHTAGGPLLRVVGSAAAARPDLWQVDAEPDMRIVMASDGLCADLGEEAAHALLVDTLGLLPQEAADELLRQALKAGGSDNITVVVADVVAQAPVARPLADADLLPARQERR